MGHGPGEIVTVNFSILGITGMLLSASLARVSAQAAETCFGRPATIVGTNGPDTIVGTANGDVIVAKGGNDTVSAGDGANGGGGVSNYICGSGGDDVIRGQKADDFINGGEGNDDPFGGESDDDGDTFVGGPGNDTFTGQDNPQSDSSPDTIDYGSTGPIKVNIDTRTITGAAGTDVISDLEQFYEIYGTRFNDVFVDGAAYAILLYGSRGDDKFTGGWIRHSGWRAGERHDAHTRRP